MKNFNSPLRRLLPVALVSAGLSATSVFAGPRDVPFKAELAITEKLNYDPGHCPAYPYMTGVITGKGTASHLGKVSVSAINCIFPTPPTFTFTEGQLKLTAANGDELRATFHGSLTPTGTKDVYMLQGPYKIMGGTGRFAGASGHGTLQGEENLATQEGTIEATGTISY